MSKKRQDDEPADTPCEHEAQQDFLTGKLLIAMPNMGDPRFERSVVFLVSHDPEHAMGIVVNKPLAEIELADLLEQLEIDPMEGAGGDTVYYGGPVQTDRGLVLHSLDYRVPQTMEIASDLGVTASKEILVDIGGKEPANNPPRQYLLAIGHAGWGPGQLEQELAVNAWCHCDANADLVFGGDEKDLWQSALKKLGVTTAMFSAEWSQTRPDDAPLN